MITEMLIKQAKNEQTRMDLLTKRSHTSALPNRKCNNVCQIVSKRHS